MAEPDLGDREIDALFATAVAAETAGELRGALTPLARAIASLEARDRRYQYLYEWRARLETGLGAHAQAARSLQIARRIAVGDAESDGEDGEDGEVQGDRGPAPAEADVRRPLSRAGVFRMDVARAEVATAALDLAEAERIFAGLRGDGPALGRATADRCGEVLAWLRALRFDERPAPNLAVLRAEAALTLAGLWAERGQYRSALRLVEAIEPDLPRAAIAIRIDQVRLLEIELRLEAGKAAQARDRLASLAPADTASDRARQALVRARAGLATGRLAEARACLDDLAAAPAGDPALFASSAAARTAILVELNLWQLAEDVAAQAIARLGAGPETEPLVRLLERARIGARARGRSVMAVWELPFTTAAARAMAGRGDAGTSLAFADEQVGVARRLTAAWTNHANQVIQALERDDLVSAAHHQARLEAVAADVESDYVAARVRLSAALVAYCRGPDPALVAELCAVADVLHGLDARGAEAQATRYAAWASAKLGRLEEYVVLARRSSQIIDEIAGELAPADRALYLLNKWNGRDELVAAKLRELLAARVPARPPRRREVCRVFREVDLLTHWPVDQAFGDRDAAKLLHSTSDVAAAWVREQLLAPAPDRRGGFTLRSPLSLWRVPARTLVLHYHVLADRTYVFRIARGHIDVVPLPIGRLHLRMDMRPLLASPNDLAELARRHIDLVPLPIGQLHPRMDMRPQLASPNDLAELAEHTGIADALARFPRTRHLVIVPHDAIANVPFAALPVGGQPLCTRVALSQLDRLDRLRRRRWRRGARRCVSVGLSSYAGSGAGDLAAAEREACAVAALTGGQAVTGDAATCDGVLGALREAPCVHIAAHGTVDRDDPARSGILLRDGAGYRTLTLHELRRTDASRVQLAILATCRSADSAVLPGGHRICLPTALLDAGARGVIASLWPVDDEPSVAIMETLYRRLRTERPSVALAATQAEMRDRPASQWAGLVFYGND